MKKTIGGHLCNTETATEIGACCSETLYVNRAGVYFVYANDTLTLLSRASAQIWAENHLSQDIVDTFFPSIEKSRGVRALRRAAGLTQQQLADAAGINLTQIQKLESGEYQVEKLQLRTALAIAQALCVSVERLKPETQTPLNGVTIISTFADFVQYAGVSKTRIKNDWSIPERELRRWINDETSVPTWLIPMLIALYDVSDRVEYHPLGSAIII